MFLFGDPVTHDLVGCSLNSSVSILIFSEYFEGGQNPAVRENKWFFKMRNFSYFYSTAGKIVYLLRFRDEVCVNPHFKRVFYL